MRYLIIFILLSLNIKAKTFGELLDDNNIIIINDTNTLTFNKCKVSRDAEGKLRYIETFLERDGDKILDFNIHFKYLNSDQQIFEIPFYSITAWDWYQLYAFKTENSEYVSNYSQVMQRRNMIVNNELIMDMMNFGKFSIFVFQDKTSDNQKYLINNVVITNPDYLRKCFSTRE